jgi:transcriptional regulator with XRE-family HTH domain
MRGLYTRVAKKLGVDRSYVSRVARGIRRSPEIEAALQREFSKLLAAVSAKNKRKKK